ncbi:probable cGMP 3',5'-cyclic phosphodiesterase subunit delta isoform X3 [Contarinia nasturtii]|uniref:probable cGMP 3',5'-cyclic phosphodiesterase subunit delta isoform X3 n=1 Tax=Contarinia nasturtii TaxID=265458 RepID=UPI0012D3D4FD|nr:probable cGMP 3',5'-cyclic phosphodiesterase subunit delta isoform X3 [Contarinia nasturtii]
MRCDLLIYKKKIVFIFATIVKMSTTEESRTEKIQNGFQINWMILRDADTGSVIWQENKDLASSGKEHNARIPTKILDLRAVSREINFSTVESIENFRLDQKILFKGRIMEEWQFEMGKSEYNKHMAINNRSSARISNDASQSTEWECHN